jgi:nitrogen fixation NifU-like protein
MLRGKSLKEALALTNQDVINELGGLPQAKVHCSILAEEAVKSAIADYYRRNNMPVDFETGCGGCDSCGAD